MPDNIDNKGWISIHRKLQDHWIYKSVHTYSQLEAWIDILLTVNHETSEITINFEKFTCGRGESLRSLDSWGKRWKWDKSKVRRFLKLLEKENMVVTKNERKTTRLTVCKYDDYQSNKNDKQNSKRNAKRNADETQMTPNNNVNKSNSKLLDRAKNFKESLFVFVKTQSNPNGKYSADMVKRFYDYWSEPNHINTKMRFEIEKTFDTSRRLSTWCERDKSSNQFNKSVAVSNLTN